MARMKEAKQVIILDVLHNKKPGCTFVLGSIFFCSSNDIKQSLY